MFTGALSGEAGKYESRLAKGMKLIRTGKLGIGLDSIHT
jgi:hypothetical protein